MDLLSFLTTVILITSAVTLVVALAAYIAYKVRDLRKPTFFKAQSQNDSTAQTVFLKPASLDRLRERLDAPDT